MNPSARKNTFEKQSIPKPFIHLNQTLTVGIGFDTAGLRLYICPLCLKTAQTRSSFCIHGREHNFPTGAELFHKPGDMNPNPPPSVARK